MNPKKLYSEDKFTGGALKPGAEPDAQCCGECGHPFCAGSEDSAERCCRCHYCGEKGERHLPQHGYLEYHHHCYNEKAAAGRKEDRDAHFSAPPAIKRTVTAIEWGDKPVFFCDEGPQDGYFNSLSELAEHFDGAEDAAGLKWVYASERMELGLDAGRIVESALEEHYEDAGADIGEEDIRGLQELLDFWCSKQNVVTYTVDYELVVLLD